jgi:hypothetical protein
MNAITPPSRPIKQSTADNEVDSIEHNLPVGEDKEHPDDLEVLPQGVLALLGQISPRDEPPLRLGPSVQGDRASMRPAPGLLDKTAPNQPPTKDVEGPGRTAGIDLKVPAIATMAGATIASATIASATMAKQKLLAPTVGAGAGKENPAPTERVDKAHLVTSTNLNMTSDVSVVAVDVNQMGQAETDAVSGEVGRDKERLLTQLPGTSDAGRGKQFHAEASAERSLPAQLMPQPKKVADAGLGDNLRSYLQVPFNKGSASGQINISKPGAEFPALLQLNPSNAEVSGHLRAHMEHLQEPRWRLMDERADDPGHGREQGSHETEEDDKPVPWQMPDALESMV